MLKKRVIIATFCTQRKYVATLYSEQQNEIAVGQVQGGA